MPNHEGVSREELLKYGAAGALSLGVLGLAACGDDDKSDSGSGTEKVELPSKPTGTLRAGFIELGASGGVDPSKGLNPAALAGNSGFAKQQALFDPLFEFEGGKPVMLLAESVEGSADAKTWNVTLRDGIEFHDGKPLRPEDVIFSLNQFAGPTSPFSFLWGGAKFKKTGPRGVEIVLPAPASTFLESHGFASLIMPENWDPKKPTGGTGPYTLVSSGDIKSVFKANPNWWREGAGPYTETLEIINFKDEAARLNALLADQIDIIEAPPVSQVTTLESQSGFGTLIVPSENGTMLVMNAADKDAFADVRVRQAMRLVVDRKAMNDQIYGGKGTVGNDILNPNSPGYIGRDIPQREVDIEQAQSLLKTAGKENLTVELSTAPIAAGATDMAEVMVEQAKAAGITIKFKQIDPAQYFSPDAGYGTRPFQSEIMIGGLGYLANVAIQLVTGAFYNISAFSDKEFDGLYAQASAETDVAKRNEIIGQMQQIEHDRGTLLIPEFAPSVTAFNDKVKNHKKARNPMNDFQLNELVVS
ncbi:MAG TPA: ABC transporter substrate-binding protein [Baekduia sp.]|nr:ABC transporter substrate-binding protein [Baekduia sp.]